MPDVIVTHDALLDRAIEIRRRLPADIQQPRPHRARSRQRIHALQERRILGQSAAEQLLLIGPLGNPARDRVELAQLIGGTEPPHVEHSARRLHHFLDLAFQPRSRVARERRPIRLEPNRQIGIMPRVALPHMGDHPAADPRHRIQLILRQRRDGITMRRAVKRRQHRHPPVQNLIERQGHAHHPALDRRDRPRADLKAQRQQFGVSGKDDRRGHAPPFTGAG